MNINILDVLKKLLYILLFVLTSCSNDIYIDLELENEYFEFKPSEKTVKSKSNFRGTLTSSSENYKGKSFIGKFEWELNRDNLLYYKGEPFTGVVYENYSNTQDEVAEEINSTYNLLNIENNALMYYSIEFKEGKIEGEFNKYNIQLDPPAFLTWNRKSKKEKIEAEYRNVQYRIDYLKSLTEEDLKKENTNSLIRDSIVKAEEEALKINPSDKKGFILINRNFLTNDSIINEEEYYSNGKLKRRNIRNYTNGDFIEWEDGAVLETYYENGQLKQRSNPNSAGEGTMELYYENGQLKRKFTVEKFKVIDDAGNEIIKKGINGVFEEYKYDGEKLFKINVEKDNYYVEDYGNFYYEDYYGPTGWRLKYNNGSILRIEDEQLPFVYSLFNGNPSIKEDTSSKKNNSDIYIFDEVENYLKAIDGGNIDEILSFWSEKPIRYWTLNEDGKKFYLEKEELKKIITKAINLSSYRKNEIKSIQLVDENKLEVEVRYKYTNRKTGTLNEIESKIIFEYDDMGKIQIEYGAN